MGQLLKEAMVSSFFSALELSKIPTNCEKVHIKTLFCMYKKETDCGQWLGMWTKALRVVKEGQWPPSGGQAGLGYHDSWDSAGCKGGCVLQLGHTSEELRS